MKNRAQPTSFSIMQEQGAREEVDGGEIFVGVTVSKEAGDVLMRNNLKEQRLSFQQLQAPEAI